MEAGRAGGREGGIKENAGREGVNGDILPYYSRGHPPTRKILGEGRERKGREGKERGREGGRGGKKEQCTLKRATLNIQSS
jgi:hypothetical protein